MRYMFIRISYKYSAYYVYVTLLHQNKFNQSFLFYASYEHYAMTTSLLDFHGLLPVTPTRKTVKQEITLSQQLLGRFRSSFQEIKPYPYASYFVISVYTKQDIDNENGYSFSSRVASYCSIYQ